VIKSFDASLSPFSRDRLFMSLYESMKHRPTALDDADGLTQTVIAMLRDRIESGLLDTHHIIEIALTVLKRFDTTASTVYKAYHPTQ